jgi:hypothetical protein
MVRLLLLCVWVSTGQLACLRMYNTKEIISKKDSGVDINHGNAVITRAFVKG